MKNLAHVARKFWCAASFYRRARYRDRRQAVAILKEIAASAPAPIQARAINLLREIDHGPDSSSRTD